MLILGKAKGLKINDLRIYFKELEKVNLKPK